MFLLLTNDVNFGSSGVILVPDLISSAYGLQSLSSLALFAHVDVDISSGVQDEAISFVHGSHGEVDLFHANVPLAFDLEQSLLHSVSVYVFEAGADSSSCVSYSVLEMGKKLLGFVLLDFAILDGIAAEVVVQLDA